MTNPVNVELPVTVSDELDPLPSAASSAPVIVVVPPTVFSADKVTSPWENKSMNPFKPIVISQMPESGSNQPYGDFSWLL